MKKISIMIPCYNETENVIPISQKVISVLEQELPAYDYELLFIDNASTDGTRAKLEQLCAENRKIRAIFNVTNFGQFNSPFHGMCETSGDCTITMCCDFQDPPELIPALVAKWEEGHRIVSGVKTASEENPLMYGLRSLYYKILKQASRADMIEHFTGFGLYDKTFIALLRELDDPTPFIRGIVGEYGAGFDLCTLEYEQPQRRAGKTHNNFLTLYDAAMLSMTSYTKVWLRISTFLGILIAAGSVLTGIGMGIRGLIVPLEGNPVLYVMLLGLFFLGGVILFFLGMIGEYLLTMNTRLMNRPVVVEERRLNFEEPKTDAAVSVRERV